jgi:hypothetical protein
MSITLKTVRRQVAGFSLAMMIASMFAIGVAQAATFADVQPTDWSYPFVEDLAAQGILDTTKTNYEPGREVNRAEMAKLAVEAWGLTLETPTEPPFKDVPLGQWFTPYIYTAKKNNIIGGYKDNEGTLTGYFGPGDSLTREQAMKVITLAASLTTNTNGGPHFSDVPVSLWSYEYVETGYNWSVVDGFPGTSLFKPGQNVLRDQVAKMVSNAMAPTLRPGAGFNVNDAYSTSLTAVTVCFSGDVGTGATTAANYDIKDSNGVTLSVTGATAATDPMCVELTTATQTESKSYDLVVSGVVSSTDEALDIADISFTGYSAVGTGGDLTCTAGEQPASVSIPKGSTGIPFAVVNCQASGDPVVISSMTFHRFGAGNEGDFDNVYLYEGDNRLTTGRSINSETQDVEFTGLNLDVTTTGVSLVVTGDINLLADSASQHGFEVMSKDSVASNASSVGGTYPIAGNLMTISGATAGTVTIRKNGSLDDLTVGETGRVAQFELEASGTEAMKLNRLALYVRGTCDATAVNELKLYEEGGSEVLAETATVGSKELATFVLDNPYVIPQGDSKIFYVTAKATCRNNETIRIYLDETTDLNVIGGTFGTGVQVNNAAYDGTAGNFSEVTVKGSDFNVAFNGPAAGDVAIGQDKVSCLDMTISNSSGQSLDIKDWDVTMSIQGAPAVAAQGGLINTIATAEANYTLIKLVKKNADGTYGSTLLGPSELNVAGNDLTQVVTLAGTNTIAAGATFDASVIFDTPSNANMAGDKIRCTLTNLATVGADYIRDPNGDALGAESITPSSDTVGNIFTWSASGLTFDVASTPSSRNLVSGTANAELLGLTVRSGASLANTLKSVTVQGYVDCDANSAGGDAVGFSGTGSAAGGAAPGYCSTPNDVATNLKDLVGSVALYNGTTKVSDIENVNVDGKVVFNNLNIEIPMSTSVNLVIKGNVNAGAPYGVSPDRLKFGLVATTDITAIDGNGKNVPATSIVDNATNGGAADSGVIMTVVSGGTGTVSDSASASASVTVGEAKKELARVKFTSSNESPVLKDLQFGILNANGSSVSKIYIAPLTGGTCGAVVGDTNGYGANGVGVFTITNLGVTIPDSTTLTLCVLGDVTQVGPLGPPASEPVSGSGVGVTLLNVTQITGGSGSNVSAKYASDQTAGEILDVDMTNVATNVNVTAAVSYGIGDVIVIDQEMMLVRATPAADQYTVIRAFGNTLATAHAARTDGTADVADDATGTRLVGLSTLAIDSTRVVPAGGIAAGATCLSVAAGGLALFQAGDVIAIPVGAAYDYSLVTDATGLCAANSLTIVRGVYGSTALLSVGGEEITRFPVHGDLFKLRRSKPTITQIPVTVTNLPGSARTRIFGFKVAATGQDDVEFTNANGNVLEVTVGGTILGGVALCTLTDGTTDYATSAAGIALNSFNFNVNPLTVSPGSSKDLFVECDTTAVATSGENISAQLVKAPTTVQWCDGSSAVPCNIATDGSLIIPSTITGSSFTMP